MQGQMSLQPFAVRTLYRLDVIYSTVATVVFLLVNYCNASLASLMGNIVLQSCCREERNPWGAVFLICSPIFWAQNPDPVSWHCLCSAQLLVSYCF